MLRPLFHPAKVSLDKLSDRLVAFCRWLAYCLSIAEAQASAASLGTFLASSWNVVPIHHVIFIIR